MDSRLSARVWAQWAWREGGDAREGREPVTARPTGEGGRTSRPARLGPQGSARPVCPILSGPRRRRLRSARKLRSSLRLGISCEVARCFGFCKAESICPQQAPLKGNQARSGCDCVRWRPEKPPQTLPFPSICGLDSKHIKLLQGGRTKKTIPSRFSVRRNPTFFREFR
jgi:hypothetical protein